MARSPPFAGILRVLYSKRWLTGNQTMAHAPPIGKGAEPRLLLSCEGTFYLFAGPRVHPVRFPQCGCVCAPLASCSQLLYLPSLSTPCAMSPPRSGTGFGATVSVAALFCKCRILWHRALPDRICFAARPHEPAPAPPFPMPRHASPLHALRPPPPAAAPPAITAGRRPRALARRRPRHPPAR